MSDIKKILVPVDFSANADKLIAYAVSFAAKFSASVSFLSVVENPLAYEGIATADANEKVKMHLENKMHKIVDEQGDKCTIGKTAVVIGDIMDTILETAKEYDLIIIATHGYRGVEKVLMGSVADRVVKNAPCPVLVYNPNK